MLTILYPEVHKYLKNFRFGLMPLFNVKENRFLLVIKALKEHILTARKNGEFKIYFLPDRTGSVSHLGFVTAFFDDHDQPLVVLTGMFARDPMVEDFTKLFSQNEFDVYFFDEHNREFFGAKALNRDYKRFSTMLDTATYPELGPSEVKSTFERLQHYFAIRNIEDDKMAYSVILGERLYSDDIILMDNSGQFHGVNGLENIVPIAELIRKNEPGPMQEKDIVLLMTRVFEKHQIFLNPIRTDTERELTDMLVVTDDIALFIQAKDSPNTEEMLARSITRKRATIRAHIEKATNQLRGVLTYSLENSHLVVKTDGQISKIPLQGRQLIGMIVVKELFDYDYQECSVSLLELVRAMQIPALLLDYSQLHEFTFRVRDANEFVNGIYTVVRFELEKMSTLN